METKDRIIQCCTCEHVFIENELTETRTCPNCGSGNWVFGYIDDPEPEESEAF
jgi:Zn finger protein HypA/HybF involved in hydrogenase expression